MLVFGSHCELMGRFAPMSPDNESRGDNPQDRERKLWFDYIAKLNDRSIQTARESGATNWVLLGVAVAILYKSVPQLPQWLSTSNALRSTLTVLVLEIDAFTFFAVAFVFLALFSAGGVASRLWPKVTERLHQITVWATEVALVILAVSGFWLAIR
jgi:hypothetical protein